MADIIHNFTSGRMNKDLDERLVPNGEYRDALNVQIATSDSSQVGTFQNLKGNIEKKNKTYNNSTKVFTEWSSNYISSLQNAVCVGSISDNTTEYIYWFIASDTVSVIASYNTSTKITAPLLVDTHNILKFSKDFLITGINILEGMLIWTDNQTEPKNIRIKDWVDSTPDFTTHSQIHGRDFVEDDTTVIRKRPLIAPTVVANDSGRGGSGTGLSPVSTTVTGTYQNFTYIPDPGEPLVSKSLPTYAEDNTLGSITITTVPAPAHYRALDLISLEAEQTDSFNNVTKYGVTLLIVGPLDANGVLLPGNTLDCRIQAISSTIPRLPDVLNWEVTLIEDKALFQYIFPRFAYRWKYSNNQVSGFSPFTTPVFVGGKFEYLSSNGYNMGMVNNARQIILENLNWGDEDVKEIEILYKASNSAAVYVVDNITDRSITQFKIINEVIGAIVNSNQLLRPYDNVPIFAKAQEVTANRIIYANYAQQYNLKEPIITSSFQQNNHPGHDPANGSVTPDNRKPYASLKSIRTYQIGANFLDKYGRETPVFTTNNSSFKVPVSSSSKINKILASLVGSEIPSFATHFKYFVKETSNEYYNLALDRFYFAEDGNIWLSFPSSERNKLRDDSYLILKKEHDNDIPVLVDARFKVLSIKNEAPDFIATTKVSIAQADVKALGAAQPGKDVIQFAFDGPDVNSNAAFNQGFTAEHYIVISQTSNTTGEYAISAGGPTGNANEYRVTLQKPLGSDAAFLDSLNAGDTFTINIKQKIVEKKPEYEGRFFVKINRDVNFDNYVISSFAGFKPTYGILESLTIPDHINNNGPGNGEQGPGWTDINAPDNYWSDKMRKPVANQKWFGVGWSGYSGGEDSPISQEYKTTPLLDNYLNSLNTKVRFVDINGNKSAVYIIAKTQTYYERRGWNDWLGRSRTTNSNAAKVVRVELNKNFEAGFIAVGIEIVQEISSDSNNILSSSNPCIFETEPREAVDIDIYYQASNAFDISEFAENKVLDWYNCYSYGNGVESNRIRDDFNAPTIDKGPVVSAPLDVPYQREIKTNTLIFSQIFNSISGVNNLNQFIQAEAITKSILPEYGSIQKLRSKDTNLVVLCEDKCLSILADKDALYNADGSANLTASNAVLGDARAFAGEFGISTNPESFAEYGYRMYFTDKTRGTVIRLSQDGITEIASKGMVSFFNDNLILNDKIIGSWDMRAKEYNVTLNTLSPYWQNTLGVGETDRLNKNSECGTFVNSLPTTATTISFKEEVDGWTSRKTFMPESGLSLNSDYYTFKNGVIWDHYSNPLHNNFYGIGQDDINLGKYYETSFTAIINEDSTTVKTFNTLNYSGSESIEYVYRVNGYGNRDFSIAEIQADKLIPSSFTTKKGWYVNSIVTDLQEGKVKEFIDKEGKKFNYIKGLQTFFNTNCNNNVDSQEFNVQGIGRAESITGHVNPSVYKVTVFVNPACFNQW
jgi:hypothetical protein